MLGARVHKLRSATRPMAFMLFRWAFYGALAAAVMCIPTPPPARSTLMRVAFACFGLSTLGFTIHFVLVSVDAALERDYITAVGMLLFIAISALIVFIGFHAAVVAGETWNLNSHDSGRRS
jgi:hypothetical protein